MGLLLGIDIGTSSTKAILLDDHDARIVASASHDYPLYSPHPGWSEQDPEDWWTATTASTRAVIQQGAARPELISSVGFSGQMHGSVLLGGDAVSSSGQATPLRRALLWNDQRTAHQCAEIETAAGGRRALVDLVGSAALTGFTLPKLLWVRENEPKVWRNVRHVLLPKDFVRFRMTGELATDVGDASGTLLFDVDHRTWSQKARDMVGIDTALLPTVAESTQVVGELSAWAAEQMGLRAATPVVAGSGDNMAGAVGAGVVEDGLVMATLGTSGVIFAHTNQPRKDTKDQQHPGRLHSMCAATGTAANPHGWCMTGVTLSAAGALKWARDTIAPDRNYDQLFEEAACVSPGSEGLVFLPYLTGERCPHPDPLARGAWIGLTSRHTRGHLIRAVIEGVTFTMAQILDLMRGLGIKVGSVRLSGGGNRSALWRQVQADVYGAPVVTTNSEEGGSALGGALMAGVGVAVWPSVADACREVVKARETIEPKNADDYRGAHDVFLKLYDDLQPRFAELSKS